MQKLNSSTARWLSYLSWPVTLLVAITVTQIGFEADRPILGFLISYFFLFFSLLALERILPFEPRWLESDGQFWNDLGHTAINKGVAQALAVMAGAFNLRELVKPLAWNGRVMWPETWPMILQVLLGLTAIEFILYWMHRVPHENPSFWRFHALHHSVKKLWVVNTGKFHFLESAVKVIGLTLFMLWIGMPMRVIYWVSALTAYIGIFTHCNIALADRWISWIFNTGTLHRWHHSPRLEEGNKNYCETIMIWDLVFGTFYHPQRRPCSDIGLNKGKMPASFYAQLKWPFTKDSIYR